MRKHGNKNKDRIRAYKSFKKSKMDKISKIVELIKEVENVRRRERKLSNVSEKFIYLSIQCWSVKRGEQNGHIFNSK